MRLPEGSGRLRPTRGRRELTHVLVRHVGSSITRRGERGAAWCARPSRRWTFGAQPGTSNRKHGWPFECRPPMRNGLDRLFVGRVAERLVQCRRESLGAQKVSLQFVVSVVFDSDVDRPNYMLD